MGRNETGGRESGRPTSAHPVDLGHATVESERTETSAMAIAPQKTASRPSAQSRAQHPLGPPITPRHANAAQPPADATCPEAAALARRVQPMEKEGSPPARKPARRRRHGPARGCVELEGRPRQRPAPVRARRCSFVGQAKGLTRRPRPRRPGGNGGAARESTASVRPASRISPRPSLPARRHQPGQQPRRQGQTSMRLPAAERPAGSSPKSPPPPSAATSAVTRLSIAGCADGRAHRHPAGQDPRQHHAPANRRQAAAQRNTRHEVSTRSAIYASRRPHTSSQEPTPPPRGGRRRRRCQARPATAAPETTG